MWFYFWQWQKLVLIVTFYLSCIIALKRSFLKVIRKICSEWLQLWCLHNGFPNFGHIHKWSFSKVLPVFVLEAKSAWSKQVYLKIFEILEKKNFENIMNKAFWGSNLDKKLINNMRNFDKDCLCLNPRLRPSVCELLEYKIVEGMRLFKENKNDIWEKKATFKKNSVSLFFYLLHKRIT